MKTTQKRGFFTLFILLTLTVVFALSISGADAEGKLSGTKIKWEITGDTLTFSIDESNTTDTSTVITHNGWGWDNKQSWNSTVSKSTITKVVIGEGITAINGAAFTSYANLTTVELPTTLTAFGKASGYGTQTFCDSKKLSTIYVAGNEPVEGTFDLSYVTTFSTDTYIFYGTQGKNIILSKNFKDTKFGDSTLPTTLQSITFPADKNATRMAEYVLSSGKLTVTALVNSPAWSYVSDLLKTMMTTYKSSLKSIELYGDYSKGLHFNDWNDTAAYFLKDFPALESVYIEKNFGIQKYSNDGLFSGCTSLRSFGIGENYKEGEVNLTGITDSAGNGKIKLNLFKGCTAIETVVFPSAGVANVIGANSFSDCTSLAKIVVPEVTTITSLPATAFSGCTAISRIDVASDDQIALFDTVTLPENVIFTVNGQLDLNKAMNFEGFSVRLEKYNGLRSIFSVKNSIPENVGYTLVEYGCGVVASANKEQVEFDITYDAKKYEGTYKKNLHRFTIFMDGEITGKILSMSNEDITYFALTVKNFNDNFTTDIYMFGYEVWMDESGEYYTLYTDYSENADFADTNIYDVSLTMYKEGAINAVEDAENIVFDVLKNGGAVEGQTEIMLSDKSGISASILYDDPTDKENSACTIIYKLEDATKETKLVKTSVFNSVPEYDKCETIVVDNGITVIGWDAFSGMGASSDSSNLTVVYPETLNRIEGYAFHNSKKLESMFMKGTKYEKGCVDLSPLSGVDGYMFKSGAITKIHMPSSGISDGISDFFIGATGITAVWCGDGSQQSGVIDLSNINIKSIGKGFFSNLTQGNIHTIIIPEGLTSLGAGEWDLPFSGLGEGVTVYQYGENATVKSFIEGLGYTYIDTSVNVR